MADNNPQIGQDILNVPMGEMIRSVAMAIADAQFQLDKSSMTVAEFMSGQRLARDLDTGELLDAAGNPTTSPTVIDSRIFFGYDVVDGKRVPKKASMTELGFVPNFYQFVDTMIEMKVAMRINKVIQAKAQVNEASVSAAGISGLRGTNGDSQQFRVTVTPVDASYASSYSYNAEAASILRTKLVPVPPPATLEERLRSLSEQEGKDSD
ncbi:hypothetical protein [Desulfonema magnum]|uniref:Uncharacterized protein n=1 Tax=Desulfonema magnum TaxID=45655 RepID=A0A975GJV3_9BACT|nr:hypothetical protein [Desulfonema magnum]QTA84011.1 Uncharacterized protein dnm_000010 [Desulfonema magnum]